jgi:hypothetical protein
VGATTLLLCTTGCFSPSDDAAARLSTLKAQGQEMDRAWDELEDRLLGTQARVFLWKEMAARHQNVSALACENAASHVAEMQRLEDRQTRKSRRVAERSTLSEGTVLARSGRPRPDRF